MTTTTDRKLNFSAGPATLPEPVLHQAQIDIWDIAQSGIGVCEHSHRGPVFGKVVEETISNCRLIGNIPDDFEILFMQGGATLQFAMLAMNFLGNGETANYVDTGVWATKAIKEAKKIGNVHLAYDGSESNYDHCPTDDAIQAIDNAAYLHYCSNNTIYGTRFSRPITSVSPVICDMSSDIFSREIDWKSFDMVYAGAQKNLGPAGVVLVVIRKSMLEKCVDTLPLMLNYKAITQKGSMLNTPPTFGIYLMGEVFKWLLSEGGLQSIEERNERKAGMIYNVLDSCSDFYTTFAQVESRSRMNISFKTKSAELDALFLEESARMGMSGLKGHRNLGGLRASIYNAFPEEGCARFAEFLDSFASTH
ncbi:MAG: phosphoserine transaminase [Phycisphaerales bacterium]|nr:phosphoserine transaminase [Planctomycetota bacterium]MBL6998058.1 phosphoserine transaminase [Phycisphaerales bacterium]